MSEINEYALENLSLRGKTVLDAATGVGGATEIWARRMDQQGGDGQIISIDIEQPEEIVARIKHRLGELRKYVEFREDDIFELATIKTESIDIINSDNTIVFLNPRPLRLLAALRKFHLVLKPGGKLIITSELPIDKEKQHMGQWKRWNLAKAVRALKGEVWSSEPHPQQVSDALEAVGFDVLGHRTVPTRKEEDYTKIMDEWELLMRAEIEEIPWPQLKKPLQQSVVQVREKVEEDGYLSVPPQYVVKCSKPA